MTQTAASTTSPTPPPSGAPPAGPPVGPKWTKELLVRFLFSSPTKVPVIRASLEWDYRTNGKPFRWSDVRAAPRDLDALVLDGVLSKSSASLYYLSDYDLVNAAVTDYMVETEKARSQMQAHQAANRPPLSDLPLPAGAPRDLFSEVVGFESIKQRLLLALGARVPYHVILFGPPGTSKTVFLLGLSSLPGAILREGPVITPAGIRHLILNEQPPYLIIDEIDKMPQKAQEMLLGIMDGRVSVLQFGDSRNGTTNVRIFAAANNMSKLKPELRSRFEKIALREYTPEEFVRVAYNHLVKTGVDPRIASATAQGVAHKSRDLRDAIRIGNSAPNVEWVNYLVGQLGMEATV